MNNQMYNNQQQYNQQQYYQQPVVKKKKTTLGVFMNYICLPIALITIFVCVCTFMIELKEARDVTNNVQKNIDQRTQEQRQQIEEYRNSIYENEYDEYDYYYDE